MLSSIASIHASHIIGGDLRVVFKSQSAAGPVYRIVFNLYYDDLYGQVPLGDANNVEIRDKRTGSLIRAVQVFKRSRITAVYPNASCRNATLVNTGIYLYDVELVLDPAIYNDVLGYYVNTVTTCCRNNPGSFNTTRPKLVNIQDGDFAFYTEFPRITNDAAAPFNNPLINSTPDFGFLSGEYLCVGQTFTASYAATDPDGDSLEYDLVDPLGTAPINATPAVTVPYLAGYSLANPFDASPAGQFRIDRLTGVVTVTPLAYPGITQANGNIYAFSVRCTEKRNGVKIGEVRREFQYLIRNACDPFFLPIPSVPGLNTTATGAYILDLNNGPLLKLQVIGSKKKNIAKVEVIPQSGNFNAADLTKIRVRTEGTGTGPAGLPPTVALGDPNLLLSINPFGIANLIIEWSECLYSKKADDIFEFDIIITDDSCPNANVSTTKIKLKVLQRNNPAPKWEIINTENIAVIDQNGSINAISKPILANGTEKVKFTVVGRDVGDLLRIRARAAGDGEYFTFIPKGITYTPPLESEDVVYSDFEWIPSCDLVRKNGRREELIIDIFIDERRSCEKLRTTLKVKLILEDNGVTSDYQPVNVITPNGDGKNELYTLPKLRNTECLYKFKKITIHNRYGKEVFQSDKENFIWGNEEVSNGLYYYRIEYENYEYKGSLHVLR